MTINKLLMAQAMLGKDAEEFASSPVGEYLLGRARQEADEALALLKSVSPWRRNRIRDLQARVWRAESVESWLAELIVEGQQAIRVIDEQTRD